MQRRRGILSLRDTIFVIHKKKMKDKVEFSNLENSTKFLVSVLLKTIVMKLLVGKKKQKKRVRIQNDEKFCPSLLLGWG